jgi:hypothetical protein
MLTILGLPNVTNKAVKKQHVMKLLALNILKVDAESGKDPIILAGATDLSSFGFFQRGGYAILKHQT